MKEKWQDETSYSRSDTKREPGVLTIKLDGWSVVLHRLIYDPGRWFLSTRSVSLLKDHKLDATDVEEAKKEAIKIVKATAKKIYDQAKGL